MKSIKFLIYSAIYLNACVEEVPLQLSQPVDQSINFVQVQDQTMIKSMAFWMIMIG